MAAHGSLGVTLFFLGEFAAARAHLEEAIALYDPEQHRSLASLYAADTGVASLCFAAVTLWMLGYPDQALERSHQGLTLAQEITHPHSLAYALVLAASLHQCYREVHVIQELAEGSIALSTEQKFAQWLALGTVLRGWVLATQGQGEAGITQMRHGLAAYRATGAEVGRPSYLALLAEAYGKVEQPEDALTILTEALALVDKTGEHSYEAELYRLKGELLQQSEGGVRHGEWTPEECFRRALSIARQQQAKSWELRAAMSLARLWQRQGKRAEARELLAPIYGWFTEGLDTADLQEAQALLEALA